MEESKITGANYILNFYNHIEQLTAAYATFINKLIPIKSKIKLEDLPDKIEGLDDKDRDELLKSLETLRFYITSVYIKSQSLKDKVKSFNDPKIKEFYEKARDKAIIEADIIEEFVIIINKCLLDDIIQHLLVQSRDIYEKLA